MVTSIISKKLAALLFISAFIIRAAVMFFFIQSNNYYKQPDSTDYHNCAISMAVGRGMHRIDSNDPIFWRTPGYPPFLAFFYRMCGLRSPSFDKNSYAQCAAIWVQIILSCFIPIILFLLAYTLTQINLIAHILAWISVIHPGLVLASVFLLSEGLALIFFFLFLLFFYRMIMRKKGQWYLLILAVLSLSAYTWMRPMGEFVGYFCALLLFFATSGSVKKRLFNTFLFGALFFATLFPWYYRNYKLTGEWFFCPTIGTYLNVFNAPKILRRTTGKNILECHKILSTQAAQAVHKKQVELQGTGKYVSNNVCKNVSVPICMSHPWYFIYDWMVESLKTTFDLYSYQLVTIANGSWWYDPIEEYLPDKIAACLYSQKVPLATRAICWLEFIFSIFVWIGMFSGMWIFVIRPLIKGNYKASLLRTWLTCIPLIGLCIGMTGGFGYARLRLPVEPLILILSLTFWYHIYKQQRYT